MAFHELKVEPWFVHRLVGDTIWQACWGERAPHIHGEVTVPQKLLTIVTHIVATMDQELRNKATDDQRAAAALTIAEQAEAQQRRTEGKAARSSGA